MANAEVLGIFARFYFVSLEDGNFNNVVEFRHALKNVLVTFEKNNGDGETDPVEHRKAVDGFN